jgi:GDPmannose 4,6-dehydratase
MDALRDWGHARDYIEAQWLMLQQDVAEDFVIATGEQHSVRDFVVRSARELSVEIQWIGHGVEERGIVVSAPAESALKVGHVLVAINPRYFRPAEVETLLGDPTKAKAKLGWKPRTTFAEMVAEMIQADLQVAKRDALVENAGYIAPKYLE